VRRKLSQGFVTGFAPNHWGLNWVGVIIERDIIVNFIKSVCLPLARAIDRFNEAVGRWVAWLAIVMALVQFSVVVGRYVFNAGSTAAQESIWYMHGLIFMLGAGYTLLHDGHVRVDVYYREASPKRKALIDGLGAVLFLIPLCVLTIYLSWSYVFNAWYNSYSGTWVLEGSTEGSGLPLIFALKTAIPVFAVLLGLQGLSMLIKAGAYLTGAVDQYSVGTPAAPDHIGGA